MFEPLALSLITVALHGTGDEKKEEGVTTTIRGLTAVMVGCASLLLLRKDVCSTPSELSAGEKTTFSDFCGKN